MAFRTPYGTVRKKRKKKQAEAAKRKRESIEEIEEWRKYWREAGPVRFAEEVLFCPPTVPPHPELGRVPKYVILSEDQKQFLTDLWKRRVSRFILSAGRGAGKTFCIAIYCAWRLCCFDDFSITVMGGTSDQSDQIKSYIDFWRDTCKEVFHCLPISRSGGNRAGRIESRWGSYARFPACSETAARGPHVTQMFLDEVCVGESKSKGGAKAIRASRYQLSASPLSLLGLTCYDEETEVLTYNSWKKISQITFNDRIATLNRKSGELEYQRPTRIYAYPYKGRMYSARNNNIDIKVTPNHRLYVKRNSNSDFELVTAEEAFGKYYYRYKATALWNKPDTEIFILPSIYRGQFGLSKEIQIKMDDWLKFFGFWLAEGWTTKNWNGSSYGYIVGIRNNDKKLLEEMKNILEKYGFKPYYHDDTTLEVSNKQLYMYLSKFGKSYEKYIPLELKQLSRRQLNILLSYYLKGDGCKRTTQTVATTSSKQLRDDLQEIALKLSLASCYYLKEKKNTEKNKIGKRRVVSKHESWMISIKRKHGLMPYADFRYGKSYERWEYYDGYVYCVEVPNHIIFVRRGGKCYWSGNSTAQYILGTFYHTWVKAEQLGYKRYRWSIARHIDDDKWFKKGTREPNWDYIDTVLYKDTNPDHWIPNVWWQTKEDIRDFRLNSSNDEFLVEVLGGMSKGSGLVFSREDLRACICNGSKFTDDGEPCDECNPYSDKCPMMKKLKITKDMISERKAGVDFGDISPNALTIVGRRGKIVFVLYSDERTGLSSEEVLNWIEKTCKKYNVYEIFADPEARSMREALEYRGFSTPNIWSMAGGSQAKKAYVNNVKRFIEQHRLIIPMAFTFLVNSLNGLSYDEGGNIRKKDDHSFDSLWESMVDYIPDEDESAFYKEVKERIIEKIWD